MIKLLTTFLFIIAGIFAYLSFNKKQVVEINKSIKNQVEDAAKTSNLNNAEKELVSLQLALNDFMSVNGRPPEKLAELTPKYFPTVPNDPSTGKPYEYSVVDNKPVISGLMLTKDQVAKKQANKKQTSENELQKEGEYINPNDIVSETEAYNPKDKRDPFKPFVFASTPIPSKNGILSNYTLGQLRLAAVAVSPSGEKKAMLEDDQGKGFTVGVGSIIGKESGVVSIIENNRIVVEIKKIDFTGKEIINTVEMKANLSGPASQIKNNEKKK